MPAVVIWDDQKWNSEDDDLTVDERLGIELLAGREWSVHEPTSSFSALFALVATLERRSTGADLFTAAAAVREHPAAEVIAALHAT